VGFAELLAFRPSDEIFVTLPSGDDEELVGLVPMAQQLKAEEAGHRVHQLRPMAETFYQPLFMPWRNFHMEHGDNHLSHRAFLWARHYDAAQNAKMLSCTNFAAVTAVISDGS
jgi:hypothetical protein